MMPGIPAPALLADGADGAASRPAWTGTPVDLRHNPRLQILVELAESLSRAQTADELLTALNSSMRKAYGPRRLFLLSVSDQPAGWYRFDRIIDFDGRTEVIDAGDRLAEPATGGFFGDVINDSFPKLFYDLSIPDDPVV